MKIYNKRCTELEENGGILETKYDIYYYGPGYVNHRDDGPAYNCKTNKHRRWYINNKLHRVDGPAIEGDNGVKSWWYNNKWIVRTEGDVTPKQLLDFKLRIL